MTNIKPIERSLEKTILDPNVFWNRHKEGAFIDGKRVIVSRTPHAYKFTAKSLSGAIYYINLIGRCIESKKYCYATVEPELKAKLYNIYDVV